MITDIALRISPREAAGRETLLARVARQAGLRTADITDFRVLRRSIDARRHPVTLNLTVRIATLPDTEVACAHEPVVFRRVPDGAPTVIVVGAGPAGLFAALRAIELGMRPVVLERGKDVDSRRLDIAALNRTGVVDPDSNYCFGEGGAGTFSDGKLFTRSKKRGNVAGALNILVQHGASPDILIDSHPHIGSDLLPHIIKEMRLTIERCGGEVRFCSRVESLLTDGSDGRMRVCGVVVSGGEVFRGPVILATGHSASDVYRMLAASGVRMEPKGLAIGVRLEHPQRLIDRIQYHSAEGRGQFLPAAEYSFVAQCGGRGVYSFCMCPGGVVVPAPSAPGELVVNGMSASARASARANSGMVVEVHPEDFPEYARYGDLCMLMLRSDLEKRFYDDGAGSGNPLNAPAQRMTDFCAGVCSTSLPDTSYAPGVHAARIDTLLPPFIAGRLQEGFAAFGRKARGFMTGDAVLIGLESRTSAPVRIPRDPVTLRHTDVEGLYPAGEGAGYAGGIISAALDGCRAASAVYESLADGCHTDNDQTL